MGRIMTQAVDTELARISETAQVIANTGCLNIETITKVQYKFFLKVFRKSYSFCVSFIPGLKMNTSTNGFENFSLSNNLNHSNSCDQEKINKYLFFHHKNN